MDQYALCCLVLALVANGAANSGASRREAVVSEPLVRLGHGGSVRGTTMSSRCGFTIYSYQGIPYAKPPQGELRFKAPVPIDPWNGVVNATKPGPKCIQKPYLYANPKVEGQEDCLYMNVYTRVPPSPNRIIRYSPLPVMVYIHGGGFFYGTGDSGEQGPEYLLDENIILVTMNYRLGVFGFLSTEDDNAWGNWALKDQVLALKWVKKNIHLFGGDPNNISIFGQSAGAASAQYLMMSPPAKGLFHKAIFQSGTAINLWAVPYASLNITIAQALFVNCTIENKTEMLNCLRKTDAKVLLDSGDKFKFFFEDPLVIFRPTVEAKTAANPNPFLPDHPVTLLKKGQFNSVPVMLGIMKNEGILRAGSLVAESMQRTVFNEKWDTLGPEVFGLQLSTEEKKVPELWKNITSFYMAENRIDENDPKSIQNFIDMYGDRGFIYSIYQAINYHLAHSKHPTYIYKNDYEGEQTFSKLYIKTNETVNYNFTDCHADDLILQFTIKDLGFQPITLSSPDIRMSKLWITFLTNFAAYGQPALYWEKTDKDRLNYLHIEGPEDNYVSNIKVTMENHLLDKRMSFWKSLDIYENK